MTAILLGGTSPCKATFKTEFLPLLEQSDYVPHVPWPITYQVFNKLLCGTVVNKELEWGECLSLNQAQLIHCTVGFLNQGDTIHSNRY